MSYDKRKEFKKARFMAIKNPNKMIGEQEYCENEQDCWKRSKRLRAQVAFQIYDTSSPRLTFRPMVRWVLTSSSLACASICSPVSSSGSGCSKRIGSPSVL